MVRKENWPVLLSLFLSERKHAPFVWGKNDCLIFAADCVHRLTECDPASLWRGYETKEQAENFLLEYGGAAGLIDTGLGIKSHRNVMKARRGDVVLVRIPEATAGVVDDTGRRIALVSEKEGLIRIPLERASKIWSY